MSETTITKDELGEWLMGLRRLHGTPVSPLPLDHNFHWAIVQKMIQLRGCICIPRVTVDENQQPLWIHSEACGLPTSPADVGPTDQELKRSRLATVLADTVYTFCADRTLERDDIARAIDNRLVEIRNFYKPDDLAQCPIVSHHGKGPCAFCLTSAMREFISI
jgi:hypothetical protein